MSEALERVVGAVRVEDPAIGSRCKVEGRIVMVEVGNSTPEPDGTLMTFATGVQSRK